MSQSIIFTVNSGRRCSMCKLHAQLWGIPGRKYKALKGQVELFSSSRAAGSRLAGFYKIAVFAVMFVLYLTIRAKILSSVTAVLWEQHIRIRFGALSCVAASRPQQISKVSISMCIKASWGRMWYQILPNWGVLKVRSFSLYFLVYFSFPNKQNHFRSYNFFPSESIFHVFSLIDWKN